MVPYAAYRGSALYDARLADAMSDYWVAFAAVGDPNGQSVTSIWPRWLAYSLAGDEYLELSAEIVARQGLRTVEYDALDRLARTRGEIRP